MPEGNDKPRSTAASPMASAHYERVGELTMLVPRLVRRAKRGADCANPVPRLAP